MNNGCYRSKFHDFYDIETGFSSCYREKGDSGRFDLNILSEIIDTKHSIKHKYRMNLQSFSILTEGMKMLHHITHNFIGSAKNA